MFASLPLLFSEGPSTEFVQTFYEFRIGDFVDSMLLS